MSSSHNLPPVRNLPHWSRVGRLDKHCAPPRPLPPARHLQQRLAGGSGGGGGGGGGGPGPPPALQPLFLSGPGPPPPHADSSGVSSSHGDMDTRVASLQNNIQFLQQQHKETLEKLHAEIDDLRRENKELQYKLIMDPPKSSRKALTLSRRGIRPPTIEAQRGFYLEQALHDTRSAQDQGLSIGECSENLGSSRQDCVPALSGGLITSLQPLRIHSSPAHPPRAPTLQECEVIIRQLYNANSMQSQEIIRVKALLRDIVFNKKITPENYILTKAYLADGSRKVSEVEKFPQLALQSLPKKMPGPSHAAVADGVILPALKQSLGSTITDRQKRTQAMQRSRLKRTVH